MPEIEPRTDLIRIDPEIMGGTPCIAGTRITVYAIAARFNGGETVEELIADWPYITRAGRSLDCLCRAHTVRRRSGWAPLAQG